MHGLPPRSTLFPYTTLFRSQRDWTVERAEQRHGLGGRMRQALGWRGQLGGGKVGARFGLVQRAGRRSEEHTSELQSQSNLVCRLLLEKKNLFICQLIPPLLT